MPDNEPKNTEWPEVVLARLGMTTGAAFDEPFIPDADDEREDEVEFERYVSLQTIRERLTAPEVAEAVGLAMEDWLFRMHGVTSSHRPGTNDDGHEARTIIEAAVDRAFPDTKDKANRNDERRVK